MKISVYNALVRRVAFQHSTRFGIDTPRSRQEQAAWCRRVRRDLPFGKYGVTWR